MMTQKPLEPNSRVPAGLTILLAEPDRMVGDYAAAGLAQHGYRIIRTTTPDDIQKLKHNSVAVDLVIADHSLLKAAQTLFNDVNNSSGSSEPVILLAGLPDIQVHLSRVGRGIDDVVVKPFNADQLALVVERVLLDRHIQRTLEELKQAATRLQEENQRLKAVLKHRIPGGVESVLQNPGSGENKKSTRQNVLQSYAEQTHFVQPAAVKSDQSQLNRKKAGN